MIRFLALYLLIGSIIIESCISYCIISKYDCKSSMSIRSSVHNTVSTKSVDVLQNGMRYRKIPHTELVVSELGLGTMNFGGQVSKSTSFSLLDQATKEYGINFIDTAEIYPEPVAASTTGNSEKFIGEWLKQHRSDSVTSKTASSIRENIVLSTKICGFSNNIDWCRAGGVGTRLTPDQIIEAVDAQLLRLGTDYIDLLQFHWPDRNYDVPMNGALFTYGRQRTDATSIETQLEAIATLLKAGKIRAFGLSNETPYGVTSFVKAAEYKSLPRPVALQNTLNLLEGHNELNMGIREACAAENGNLGFIAHSPLAGGALTGKYMDLKAAPRSARMRKYAGYMNRYVSVPATQAVLALLEVAQDYEIPLSALALAWVYSEPAVLSTLLGGTSPQQLRENVLALNLAPLESQLQASLDAVCRVHVDPTKGSFPVVHPDEEIVDPSTLPWGSRDEDLDPELDQLMTKRL